jgi:hypothetical protein
VLRSVRPVDAERVAKFRDMMYFVGVSHYRLKRVSLSFRTSPTVSASGH